MRFPNLLVNPFTALTLFAIVIGGKASAQADKINFSGNWQLDQQRTELGNIPASAASSAIKVNQDRDSIFIERLGVVHVLEGLPVNGAATPVDFSGGSKIATVQFTNRGTMEENATYSHDSTADAPKVYPVKSQEIWSLSDNNRTLQIMRTVEMANYGTYSIKTVYSKQD